MKIDQIIAFQTATEEYGIPITYVTSIDKLEQVKFIPKMPDFMLGVVRVRGVLIPVIDMTKILYKRSYFQSDKTRIIIVHTNDGFSAALIVEDAREIISLPEDCVKKLNILAYYQTPYFLGLANLPPRIITILDPEQLFSSLDGMQAVREYMMKSDEDE